MFCLRILPADNGELDIDEVDGDVSMFEALVLGGGAIFDMEVEEAEEEMGDDNEYGLDVAKVVSWSAPNMVQTHQTGQMQ